MGCPFLFGGFASPFPTTEPKIRHPRPAPDGASCEKCPRIRPYSVVAPSGAGRGVLGRRSRFNNGSTIPLSAPKSECDARPSLVAELPLLLGAARRRWRLVVPCSSQRWLCRVPLGGVGVVPCSSQRRVLGLPLSGVGSCFAFPNESPWASHPRARLGCALLLPKVALACAIGRGSRS